MVEEFCKFPSRNDQQWAERSIGAMRRSQRAYLTTASASFLAKPRSGFLHVYLFENPQVFEDIIDGLQHSARSLETCPTLVCTSGWPSAATPQLLNPLITTRPDVVLHYSGDFDLPGLRIAAYLQKRYPAHCQLWHFDPASYLAALHYKSTSLAPADYAAFQSLPASFAPLITNIRERKQKAYQEGITNLLLEDVLIKRAFS